MKLHSDIPFVLYEINSTAIVTLISNYTSLLSLKYTYNGNSLKYEFSANKYIHKIRFLQWLFNWFVAFLRAIFV